jgi:hypothetical protein
MDFLQTLLYEPLFELFFWEISTARIETNLLRSNPASVLLRVIA